MFPGVKAPEGQQWQEGRGSLHRAGSPWTPPHHPGQLPCQPCSSPLAQDDPELGVVQAGDRHIRQLKLLQLPYNCREQQLSSSSVLGEPPGPPPPSAGPPAPGTGLSLWGKVLLSPPQGRWPTRPLWGFPQRALLTGESSILCLSHQEEAEVADQVIGQIQLGGHSLRARAGGDDFPHRDSTSVSSPWSPMVRSSPRNLRGTPYEGSQDLC